MLKNKLVGGVYCIDGSWQLLFVRSRVSVLRLTGSNVFGKASKGDTTYVSCIEWSYMRLQRTARIYAVTSRDNAKLPKGAVGGRCCLGIATVLAQVLTYF